MLPYCKDTVTRTAGEPNFRKAALFMTATSFLVPLGGLVTAPVLARALGTDGRGELAASLAPSALVLAAATLGLPDALTYFVAKRPSITRRALVWGSLVTALLGVVCSLLVWVALPFLSVGDAELGDLIMLAAWWTVPALVVGVFRGAAIGRQMWGTVALERVLMTVLRVVCFFGLWAVGLLTVYTAVVVSIALPILVGVVYVVLLKRPPRDSDQELEDERQMAPIFAYGGRVWLGSVASMVLSRLAPLLMLPLSDAHALGLYTVATTISDLPLIVALAIQGALFGVSSRATDAHRVTATSRLTLLVGTVGCFLIGVSLPLWIGPLFGDEFNAAIWPTIMLLVSALICIPGLMAASGLSAWGRPGLRSAGLFAALAANLSAFVLLVPLWGVYGATTTSIISNVVLTLVMVLTVSRVMKVPAVEFVAVRGGDVVQLWNEGKRLWSAMRGRRGNGR